MYILDMSFFYTKFEISSLQFSRNSIPRNLWFLFFNLGNFLSSWQPTLSVFGKFWHSAIARYMILCDTFWFPQSSAQMQSIELNEFCLLNQCDIFLFCSGTYERYKVRLAALLCQFLDLLTLQDEYFIFPLVRLITEDFTLWFLTFLGFKLVA